MRFSYMRRARVPRTCMRSIDRRDLALIAPYRRTLRMVPATTSRRAVNSSDLKLDLLLYLTMNATSRSMVHYSDLRYSAYQVGESSCNAVPFGPLLD